MIYRRVLVPGVTYFFTINLLNRKSSLLINHIEKLRYSFRHVIKKFPFEVDGLVIMPDHIHLMMTLPTGDCNYSQRLNFIKGLFSRQITSVECISSSRRKKHERGIWQRRFWEHVIRDEADYEKHLNYIHYNPVKHGYVSNPIEWQYSSIHKYIRLGILPENWACDSDNGSELFGES